MELTKFNCNVSCNVELHIVLLGLTVPVLSYLKLDMLVEKKKKVKAKLLVNIIVCSYNIINWLFVTKLVKKNQLIKQWQTIRKMKDKTSDSDLEFSGETVSL